MALKFITAEEAASYVHHNDNVWFQWFYTRRMPESRSRSYRPEGSGRTR